MYQLVMSKANFKPLYESKDLKNGEETHPLSQLAREQWDGSHIRQADPEEREFNLHIHCPQKA